MFTIGIPAMSLGTHKIEFVIYMSKIKDHKSSLEMAWRPSYYKIIRANIHVLHHRNTKSPTTVLFDGAQISSRLDRGPIGPVHTDSHTLGKPLAAEL